MYKLALILGATATLVAASAVPGAAQAHRHHYYHRYGSGCQRAERRSGTGGAVVGGVGGAVVGNALTHGSVAGTLIGGGVGALAGHKIGQDSHNC